MGKKSSTPPPRASRFAGIGFVVKLAALYLFVNFVVQVVRKPTEIASLFSFSMYKTPTETWNSYKSYFQSSATEATPADFLAALAHIESNGNPWASPGWRFKINARIFDLYAPATTAVGLYQFLDETFRNAGIGETFSNRLSPESSTRIAATYLNRELAKIIYEQKLQKTTNERKQILAAIVHLCGKQKAINFARAGYSWAAIGNCGAHDPQVYTQRVLSLKRTFGQLMNADDRSVASIR